MKITPIEIRKKSFEKVFRGYEKEEVDAFLNTLSFEWEKLLEESRQHKKKHENAEKEVERLKNVENSLFKTLKSAETTGASVVEQANRAAELHLKEAQMRAEGVLNEARIRARNLIEEAEEKVSEMMGDMQDTVKEIIKEFNYLEDQKEFLLQSLQGFANETLERVERAKNKSGKKELEKRLKAIKAMVFEQKLFEQSDKRFAEPPFTAQSAYGQLDIEAIQEEKKGEHDVYQEERKNENSGAEDDSKSFFDNL